MRRLAALGLVVVLALGIGAVRAAAAVPAYHPSRLANIGDAGQVVVVTGRGRTSSYATLRTYVRNADGSWSAKFAAMPARNGYAGWAWGGKRVQKTGTSPMGTFRITSAFGLEGDPGVLLPYVRADGDDYWVGDNRDPDTYNLFQPWASSTRTWRISEAERLSDYPKQYEYVAVIDFNRPGGSSVAWDAEHSQRVTRRPVSVRRGAAIFLHVKGAGATAGCVSIGRANLLTVLRWLNPAKKPRIVMAPLADIGRV